MVLKFQPFFAAARYLDSSYVKREYKNRLTCNFDGSLPVSPLKIARKMQDPVELVRGSNKLVEIEILSSKPEERKSSGKMTRINKQITDRLLA